MTDDETRAVAEAVKGAVKEQLPETLAEHLSPMLRRTVKEVVRPFRRGLTVGYVVLAVACGILFVKLSNQADDNTQANNRQDCFLAGLIRRSVDDNQQKLTVKQKADSVQIIAELENGKRCKRRISNAKKGNP